MAENFNLPSFGAGFGAGVASSYVAYRAWRSIARYRASRNQGPQRITQVQAPSNANPNYQKALIELAQTSHLLGHRLALSDIVQEPRFIQLEKLVEVPDEGEEQPIFDVIPRTHDFPSLYAPYNVPTLSIDDISRGQGTLVLVGMPGSGRTTALMTIALWSMGLIEFEEPDDPVKERLKDVEQKMSPEDIAERVRRRVALSEEGRRKYLTSPENQDGDEEELLEDEDQATLERISPYRQLEPLYIHLSNILPDSGEYGRRVDPAEPLMRGLQEEVGWLTQRQMVNNLYALLKSNTALILIDGFDDLTPDAQQAALGWLNGFVELYGNKGNRIIITAPPEGFGLFRQIGAVPVFLRPWNDQMRADHLRNWYEQWDQISEQSPYLVKSDDPEADRVTLTVEEIKKGSRALNAFDFALHAWAQIEGRSEQNESAQLQALMQDVFPDAQEHHDDLMRLAARQLDNGHVTIAQVVEYLMLENASDLDPEEDASEIKKLERQYTRETEQLIEQLVKANLLIPYRNERFRFQHTLVAAYYGALSLRDAPMRVVLRKGQQPMWRWALGYLAQMRDIDPLVAQQLQHDSDVLLAPTLEITRWLRYAGEEASWRDNFLRYLGNLLVTPHQYLLLRERIAAALISSRDPGALVIFRRAFKEHNADVRRVGMFALGAANDVLAVDSLTDRAVEEEQEYMRVAATLALGGIDNTEALISLAEILQIATSRDVQRAAAESLAAHRRDGYPTLYDAVRASEYPLRRAAVFGLSRVPTDWALVAINEAYLEDSEYIVRSAAEVVFYQLYEAQRNGIQSYPPEEFVPWLAEWGEEQRQRGNLPPDIEGRDLTLAALNYTDDPLIRLLALVTIGQIGLYDLSDEAYNALRDRQEAIRDAAYRVLGQFQMDFGKALPSPV